MPGAAYATTAWHGAIQAVRQWVWLWSPPSHYKPKHGKPCSPVGRAVAPPKQAATSVQLSRQGRKDDRCHRPRLPVTGNQLPPVSSLSSPRTRTNSPAELLLPDLPPSRPLSGPARASVLLALGSSMNRPCRKDRRGHDRAKSLERCTDGGTWEGFFEEEAAVGREGMGALWEQACR